MNNAPSPVMKEFEILIGNLCNFKCKYCFENNTNKSTTITWDILKRWAEFINWSKHKFYKNDLIKVTIFGGEPTLQLDIIDRFIGRICHSVNNVHIVTNASLPGDTKNKLLALKKYNKFINIVIIASYDFINQNETRQKDSYKLVRENIKWLYNNMGTRRCITVFSSANFHKIHDVFFDYLELKKELPELYLDYNIDRYENIPINLDESSIRSSCLQVKEYLDKYPELKNYFQYNGCIGIKRSESPEDHCFLKGIVISMDENGVLYPGYDTKFESPTVVDLLTIGHISEPFDVIEQKRRYLLDKLPKDPNPICEKCSVPCRIFPWRVMKTSLEEWNSLPNEGHCRVHKLLGEYLK